MASRAVWFASDQLIYSLVARPEVRTLRELRSKRLGVGGLGDTTEVSLRVGLEAAGEIPEGLRHSRCWQCKFDERPRKRGHRCGAAESVPLLYYAKKKGFRELLDIGAHVKMPLGGQYLSFDDSESSRRNAPPDARDATRQAQSVAIKNQAST